MAALRTRVKVTRAQTRLMTTCDIARRFGKMPFGLATSVEQPDKLRGARRHVLYVNEANNIPFDAYNQLAIRTSGDIWIDFNPTANFWAHKEVAIEDDVDFITLTYLDNEALPDTIVKDIESARDKAKDSSYWSNWE